MGQKLTLKLKVRDPKAPVNPKKFGGHGICQNVSSSKNMKKPTDDADVIATESCQLLLKLKVNKQNKNRNILTLILINNFVWL